METLPANQQPNSLLKAVEESGVAPNVAEFIVNSFAEYYGDATPIVATGYNLVVTSAEQKGLMKEARNLRLQLRDIRLKADKTRKELKEDSTRYGKAVQAAYNILAAQVEDLEAHLQKQENFEEELIKAQQAEIRAKREEIIRNEDLINFFSQGQDLGKLLEVDFQDFLDVARNRKAKAEKDYADQQALRAENERLRKAADEAAAREAAERTAREAAERERAMAEYELKEQQERKKYANEAASDFEKLRAVQEQLKSFYLPGCQSTFGAKMIAQVRFLLDKVVNHIEDNIKTLEQ